ncbi:DUF1289 domain-containing protein [Oleisolibacter albus]|uniref:DUF1289 domain-containing protein n=1 Tax=Oleisolibacter albus TaxID=2171757 RepID=UPI000DF3F767|nr:DUF1289 domain-containing protein [Oleisolibacter albus]
MTLPDPDDYVPSPCVRICRLDARRRYCVGCLRTVEEIAAWGGMGSDQRRAVLADLVERKR